MHMRCVRMESTANTRALPPAAICASTGSSEVDTERKMRLVFSSGFSFFTARLSYDCKGVNKGEVQTRGAMYSVEQFQESQSGADWHEIWSGRELCR